MKNIATKILGILLTVTAIAPAALAAEVNAYTPLGLVDAAYSGRLEGIPSFGDLEAKILALDIEPEDLVEAAIAEGRLTENHLADRGFLNAVEAGLDSIIDVDN